MMICFIYSILIFKKMEKEIKKLSKLKLNQLSKSELDQRAMSVLKGGGAPGCSCSGWHYAHAYWRT